MTKDEELIERAANIAYRVCAETRHVTLGDKAANAIRAELRPADRLKALAQPVVGVATELGDPADWQEKLDELHGWSGSAWLAGDQDDEPDATRKAQCYSFLCSLIGYLMSGRDAAALAASPAPVVGDREAIARIIEPDAFKTETASHNRVWRNVSLSEGRRGALAKADAILSLSTPVVGGIKDALGQTLTLIDDLYREYGIALNDEHVAVARHARGVWLDAPDPHTTDRAGMAQEVE